jgi:hypothetical protein
MRNQEILYLYTTFRKSQLSEPDSSDVLLIWYRRRAITRSLGTSRDNIATLA